MDMTSIVALGIIGAALSVLLKQYHKEYAMVVSLVTGLLILFFIIGQLTPILEELQTLYQSSQEVQSYLPILFKSIGICFLTQIASDTCRDAGESAIASKVEMAGKIAVLLISLPLFRQILSVGAQLISQ